LTGHCNNSLRGEKLEITGGFTFSPEKTAARRPCVKQTLQAVVPEKICASDKKKKPADK